MRNHTVISRLALSGAMLLFVAGQREVRADESPAASLNKQLQEQAPEILKQLRDKGYKNVGVLKFRIKKGTEPVSDSVGTLNMFLADRLEVALILANSNEATKQIGILKRASSVAAKIPGASHVTAGGREKLFQAEYPLAWGGSSVKPDAFLTGIAQVSADLKQITVGVLVFDASGGALAKVVPPFDATMSPALLGEVGESFVVRGAFDSGKTELKADPATKAVPTGDALAAKVADVSAKIKSKEAPHPLADPGCPVLLEVTYDGRPVSVEFRDGKAFIAEPHEGQKVVLTLRRAATAKGRLGVVVKVNGESTLERQRLPDADCRKWILEPGAGPIKLEGYQLDNSTAEAFRVLSAAESKAAEMNYGADVGTISMTVFREVGGDPIPETTPSKSTVTQPEPTKIAKKPDPSPTLPTDLPDESAEDLLALSRGIQPKATPKNLAALKHQLREGTRSTDTRGLIAQGQQTASNVVKVSFVTDPTPLVSATVVYYNATSGSKSAN